MKITQLWIYPIKSLSGIPLLSAKAEGRGFQYDRRWMLINENNRFLTQREFKEMAFLQPVLEDGKMKIIHKTKTIEPLFFPLNPTENERITVQVWQDTVDAVLMGDDCHQWFSDVLGANIRLVYMADNSDRQINQNYASKGETVSFSDGYPYLILGEEAMNLLNSKLENAVPANRFRANILFEGGEAHLEDSFKNIKIGGVNFRSSKPCVRCQVPNIEQETAEIKKEPNKTLATYRRKEKGVIFGELLCLSLEQEKEDLEIKVGDDLEML